jgi:hypothetical protein
MTSVVDATKSYEAWARRRIDLIGGDLRLKHARMAAAPFPFLRATFYRWVALWREACAELADAPSVLAVGDLHVENFGTWRDAEGRLAWGINDFDEAFPLPYALDLVRLATSALLAIDEHQLAISPERAASAILAGYRSGIASGDGEPFVLEEEHPALRAMALGAERDPVRFWTKLSAAKPVAAPRGVRRLLARHLPEARSETRILHRIAGLGSLGRPRYLALAEVAGALVAREAKAMLPSACAWAGLGHAERVFYAAILERAVRSPDPFLVIDKGWLVRRLAPRSSRIALADLPKRRDELRLLEAMGQETANVHLGTEGAATGIARDLRRRGGRWLFAGAQRMAEATLADWRAWRKSRAG